jgi:hypothetical protein
MILSIVGNLLYYVLMSALLVIAYFVLRVFMTCFRQRQYMRQGVPFSGTPWYSLKTDMPTFVKNFMKCDSGFKSRGVMTDTFGSGDIAPIVGMNMIQEVQLFVTEPSVIQEIYIDANKFHTKHDSIRDFAALWCPTAIFFQKSEDKTYMPKRKLMSAAFFKSKLGSLIEIIKDIMYKHLRETHDQTEVNISHFTMLQQARIIINIAVGKAGESLLIPYEEVGGEIKQVGLGDHIDLVLHDCSKRFVQPHMHLLPWF